MISAEMTGFDVFATLTRSERLRATVQRALEQEAAALADAIREAAPEDSGALRDSVRVEPGERPLLVWVKAGGTPETTKTSAAGTFDEALMTEYGTSQREAQPFFYPTIEQMRDKLKGNIDLMIGDIGESL